MRCIGFLHLTHKYEFDKTLTEINSHLKINGKRRFSLHY